METTTLLTPSAAVIGIVIVVQIVKLLEQKYLNVLSERSKDVLYSILAPLLVLILALLGQLQVDSVYTLLPLLFAPNGLYTFIKKLLQK